MNYIHLCEVESECAPYEGFDVSSDDVDMVPDCTNPKAVPLCRLYDWCNCCLCGDEPHCEHFEPSVDESRYYPSCVLRGKALHPLTFKVDI